MSAGLFVLSCPECGGELAVDHLGTTSSCALCQRSYLNRFGHLIPIDFHEPIDLRESIDLGEPHREQDVLPAPLG